ncbi:MAG: PTS galactitol transporter subunit IIB [Candidatus Heimdallarchaeota archaeon]|nr:PTS galactitol transporter subunit IIB [Candidatus Heimdallarchaeota archaeon]
MVKKILVACGTAIATATVVATKVKELCKANKIPADVNQCKSFEVKSKTNFQKYDLIVSSTKVSGETTEDGKRTINGVPILNAIPFLSGMNKEQLEQDILNVLQGE